MIIKEKVKWLVNSKDKGIEDFFSKNSRKDIRKLLKQLDESNIKYGYEPLDSENFDNFIELYEKEIKKKNNSKIHNLKERYNDEIGKNILYFLYIKDNNNTLIGGGIGIKRDDTFIFGYKITDTSYIFNVKLKIGIGNLLDYLLFKTGIEDIKASYISFGKDRNGYGLIGAKPTLAMTKLSKGLMPYDFEGNTEIELNEKEIKEDSIIFEKIGKDNKFLEATFYINKELSDEEIKIKYSALLNSKLKTNIIKYEI